MVRFHVLGLILSVCGCQEREQIKWKLIFAHKQVQSEIKSDRTHETAPLFLYNIVKIATPSFGLYRKAIAANLNEYCVFSWSICRESAWTFSSVCPIDFFCSYINEALYIRANDKTVVPESLFCFFAFPMVERIFLVTWTKYKTQWLSFVLCESWSCAW